MNHTAGGILALLLGLSAAAGDERPARTPTPAEQYQAFLKEFTAAARTLWTADDDAEKKKAAANVYRLTPRVLELVEKNPNDPIALDVLVQVITQELWLENNTTHPGYGKNSPEARAIAILLRDHVRSEKIGEACRRVHYGFRKECETFLRTLLEKNPHREVQALACLRLAQFLNGRLRQLDLLRGHPEMARRYEGLFGKEYLDALQRQDRARAVKEVEAFFERAAEDYGDVKVPFGTTVEAQAQSELDEIRHLSVGQAAQDIEGEDQDGKRFKLSDYRGKVVLLYFWSEF